MPRAQEHEGRHLAKPLQDLFPLPSNTFERYMLGDDRESHPMAAFMEIDIRGTIDPDVLLRAFLLALDRHPLLRARVGYNRLGLPYWDLAGPRQPDIADWGTPLSCPEGERLDLTAGTGMRAWIRCAPGQTRITIQVHHACSDALGKLTFLADWLHLCTQLAANGSTPPLPEPNWGALRRRSQAVPTSREQRRNARPTGLLHDLVRFFHRPTVRLPGVPFEQSGEQASLPGLYGVSVSDDVFQRIRYEAHKLCVSVNDWLLTALHVALADWTATHGPEPLRKMFRVTVPYNMRTDDSTYSPASNQIGYEVLSNPIDAGKDFDALSREIARCMGPVRKLRTSSFMKLLRVSKAYSQLFPFIAQNWTKSFATVIFSNVGDVSRLFDPLVSKRNGLWTFGDLTVERIACAPPTRPQTHLAMVVMRYGGRLHFSTRCEGRVLAPSSIRGFLDHYRSTVLGLVGMEEEDVVPSFDCPPSTVADSA